MTIREAIAYKERIVAELRSEIAQREQDGRGVKRLQRKLDGHRLDLMVIRRDVR